ncbi:MAG: hypothetical protein WBD46_17730 [Acidobacteriaceae bacterium]
MRRLRCRTAIGVRWAACVLLAAGGCKTSTDATAAASQMAKTAQTLCSYYAALETTFTETDELFQLNQALYGKPYTPENREQLQADKAELAKRAQLASDLSALSDSFSKLSASTGASDVATAASQVESDAEKLAGVKVSSAEQDALKLAVQALASAIQQHKEREAAKAMEGTAQALSDFFAKETDVWNSTEQVYAQIAANLAGNLVDTNATDNTAVLDVALTPFGLVRGSPSADMNAKLAPMAKQQIAAKQAALDAAYTSATDSMAKALKEMAQRIQQVAEDKPMTFRTQPLSLANVQQWATQVTTLANEVAPATTSSGSSKSSGSGQEN